VQTRKIERSLLNACISLHKFDMMGLAMAALLMPVAPDHYLLR
jgi:hypothetical protein